MNLSAHAVAACIAVGFTVPACATRAPESVPAPAGAAVGLFERQVAPFRVQDAQGVDYDHPFLGGFNVPRPQLVDIDGDGDVDLFTQELTGRVMFFERTTREGGGSWVWRSDQFHELAVGEWYRFVDIDLDGDADLFTEEPFSYIRFYRNEGTKERPAFALVVDTLRDVNGEPIFSDRQNIPNFTDIDCDGVLDLFIGRLVGTVIHYAGTGLGPDGAPRFRFVTDRFQNIEIISQFGTMHGANTMAFVDIDADGDQDFFWGDFFDATLLFIENTGSCEVPSLRGQPQPFPQSNPIETSGYNAPAFGDLDGDGDLDLLVGVLGGAFNANRTAVDNFYHLEQGPVGQFVERTRRFLRTVDVGSESVPAAADLDGDGDPDLLLANKLDPQLLRTSQIYRFENIGTASTPVLRHGGALNLEGQYHYAPTFGDLDADGDVDMILGSWRASLEFHRNVGTRTAAQFVLEDSAMVTLTRGSNSTPALVDIDADGDLDLYVGEASGTINFYRNDGTPSSPMFKLVTDEFEGIDVGRRSFPTFTDLDNDGDQDLIIGTETGHLLVYQNVGSPVAPAFAPSDTLDVRVPGFAAPAFVDMNADGQLDLIVGTVGGGLLYFQRRPPDR